MAQVFRDRDQNRDRSESPRTSLDLALVDHLGASVRAACEAGRWSVVEQLTPLLRAAMGMTPIAKSTEADDEAQRKVEEVWAAAAEKIGAEEPDEIEEVE